MSVMRRATIRENHAMIQASSDTVNECTHADIYSTVPPQRKQFKSKLYFVNKYE